MLDHFVNFFSRSTFLHSCAPVLQILNSRDMLCICLWKFIIYHILSHVFYLSIFAQVEMVSPTLMYVLKTVEQWSGKVFVFRTLLVQWQEGYRNGPVSGRWWCTSVKKEAASFSTWWNGFPAHTTKKGFSQPSIGGNHPQWNNWNIHLRRFEPGGSWTVSK